MAGPKGENGIAQIKFAEINQDARVFVAELAKDERVAYELGTKRHAWVHVVKGSVTVNGTALRTGDAAALSDEQALTVTGEGSGPSEVLLFDLA